MSYFQPLVSPAALVERLLQFSEARHRKAHSRFLCEMITGIIATGSTVVSQIARFLNETQSLASTENRLCKMLGNQALDWSDLRLRVLELGSRKVKMDDVIAFDPGDLTKEYATKMEKLYRVHDGSKNTCANGFEDFSVEAIQWQKGQKIHVPLYQKLINASCEDYLSQNRQIIDAIWTVYEAIGSRGIWTFDRGHDRSRIIQGPLFTLPIRWILRAKENRKIVPDPKFLEAGESTIGLMDLASKLPLKSEFVRLLSPQRSGYLHFAWTKVAFFFDSERRPITLVVAKDERNKSPIVMLTNIKVESNEEAALVLGYYLQRWGKEEGYRFIKSFLGSEKIRTINWESTQNLAFLAFLSYSYITLFHQSSQDEVEQHTEAKIKNFKPISKIYFKYYRVGLLMRHLLKEQREGLASKAHDKNAS